jgi:hypothetical protein
MSGLMHYFYLVPQDVYMQQYKGCLARQNFNSFECVAISDEIILLARKYFDWVKTKNYKCEKEGYGLNYHAITVIQTEHLLLFNKLINLLISLYNLAPRNLDISNLANTTEKGSERGIIDKEEIINELLLLDELTKKAISENAWIIHFGV